MTTSPPISTADRERAKELCAKATSGPWHPGHLGDPETTCECRSIVDEGHAGGIAEVHMDNGISLISEGGNDAPSREQAIANMHLIAFARTAIPSFEARVVELEAALQAEKARTEELEAIKADELERIASRLQEADRARATALLEALQPFEALAVDAAVSTVADEDDQVRIAVMVTLGDLRRARAAVLAHGAPNERK